MPASSKRPCDRQRQSRRLRVENRRLNFPCFQSIKKITVAKFVRSAGCRIREVDTDRLYRIRRVRMYRMHSLPPPAQKAPRWTVSDKRTISPDRVIGQNNKISPLISTRRACTVLKTEDGETTGGMTTALNFVEPVPQPAYLKTWPRSRSRIATFIHGAIENGKEQGCFGVRGMTTISSSLPTCSP